MEEKETLYTFLHNKEILSNNFLRFVERKHPLFEDTGLKREDILLLYHIFDEDFIVEQANLFYKTNYQSLTNYVIEKPEKELYSKLPKHIVPLRLDGSVLHVASMQPLTQISLREITLATGIPKIVPVKALRVAVECKISEITGRPSESEQYISPRDKSDILFIDAVEANATDIHMESIFDIKNDRYLYPVKFRIATSIDYWSRFNLNAEDNQKIISTIVRRTKGSEDALATPRGVEASIEDLIGDGDWAARVSAGEINGGYKCVIRPHQTKKAVMTLDMLGFDDRDIAKLEDLSNVETGVIWVTGAFGSGKNTTINSLIYTMLQKRSFIGAEFSNPIEVRMPINQVAFASADDLLERLSALKKQDTDLVFIGEVPDNKVARGVKELIDSNVQVITTTHMDRCWSIPQKLYDYYDEEYINTLDKVNAVITQVMFGKLCPYCREEIIVPTTTELDYMMRLGVSKAYRKHDKGCPMCNFRGTKGVTPRVEILSFNQDLLEQLLQYKSPIAMSQFLLKYVLSKGLNVETTLKKPIEEGYIDINQVKQRHLCEFGE